MMFQASNPGQFDNADLENVWKHGKPPNSLVCPVSRCRLDLQSENDKRVFCSQGPVGIGTENPTATLSVFGDVMCTGTIFHPSDERLKENIQQVCCKGSKNCLYFFHARF